MHFDVLIVGAGHAGAQAGIALRQQGYQGSIGVVGDEPDLPYERPPLSKEYLAGEKTFDRLLIRPAQFWEERQVAMLTGRRATSVDPEGHLVGFSKGETIGYGKLIWAAGGRARQLSCSGADLEKVHSVRCRADVDRMMNELAATERVVVVGGGYIGLEAAAVLSKLGKRVIVLEALDRVLARVAGEAISRFYQAEHRAHGVEIRTGVSVECIEAREGVASGVRLSSGEILPADMVLVGIGIIPNVEPLLAAGAAGENGLLVDAYCQTSLPDIFAVGDCALHANRFAAGGLVRLESVQNATDQATTAARKITGGDAPYDAVPWFWSNQYDLKLQTVGLNVGYDEIVVRGDPASRSFSAIYLRNGAVIALDCINAVKDYVQGRKLVTEGSIVAPDRLGDASTPLKELV